MESLEEVKIKLDEVMNKVLELKEEVSLAKQMVEKIEEQEK